VKEEQLAKIYESYETVGTVLPEIAKELGIPENVKVAAGGGDNAAAAVGTGTVGDGMCNISLGTSGTIFISSDKFGVDKFNAAGVGDIDITSLKSQVAAAQADALSGETLHKLTDIYRRAIASENAGNLISGESLAQINNLLKEEHRQNTGSYDGFQKITFETSSSNSGTVQIHGNNSNSNGPIVQTGNDARQELF